MKSTKRSQGFAEKQSINFNAKFAGETLVTPVCFNPTVEQIKKIKKLPESFEIREPNYIRTIKEKEYSVVSLLCKFNPNEILDLKEPSYSDEVFINYDILCSMDDVVGGKSGKTQVIDEHNQTGWIRLTGKKSLEAQLTAVREGSEYNEFDPIRRVDPATARKAKVGEVALYQLVFDMSSLDLHRPDKDEPTNLDKGTHLTEFKLGENPHETFEHICKGEVSSLNMLMATNSQDFEGKEFFITKGKQNQIGMFLGIGEYDGKLYQNVLTSPTFLNISKHVTFRPHDRVNDYDEHGESRLPKEAYATLVDEEYPWDAYWGNKLGFKEVKPGDIENDSTPGNDFQEEEEDFSSPF